MYTVASFEIAILYPARCWPAGISAGGCDKGTAARRLADTLGRSILVCVGDAPNDLAMLQAADYGFRTGDCDPPCALLTSADAACHECRGSVASAIDALRTLL